MGNYFEGEAARARAEEAYGEDYGEHGNCYEREDSWYAEIAEKKAD